MAYELMFTGEEISKLKNSELKKSLIKISRAVETGRTSAWTFAKGIHEIIANETFTEDFGTKDAFSKYIGVSKTTITMYVNAVDFSNTAEGKEMFGDIQSNMTVGKAYLLSALKSEELVKVADFFTEHEELSTKTLSDKSFRQLLKDMFKEPKKVEEKEEGKSETDTLHEEKDETSADTTISEEQTEPSKETPENANEEKEDVVTAKSDSGLEVNVNIANDYKKLIITFVSGKNVKAREYKLDADIIAFIKAANTGK